MKYLGIVLLAILATALAGCGGKTRLVPQPYMPEPPAILMQPPKELHTIKKETKKQEEAPKDD